MLGAILRAVLSAGWIAFACGGRQKHRVIHPAAFFGFFRFFRLNPGLSVFIHYTAGKGNPYNSKCQGPGAPGPYRVEDV